MLKKTFKVVFFTLMFIFSTQSIFADVCCPDDPDFDAGACTGGGGVVLAPGCSGGGPGPSSIPVDGGVTLFAGLAAAYGARRIYQSRLKK